MKPLDHHLKEALSVSLIKVDLLWGTPRGSHMMGRPREPDPQRLRRRFNHTLANMCLQNPHPCPHGLPRLLSPHRKQAGSLG